MKNREWHAVRAAWLCGVLLGSSCSAHRSKCEGADGARDCAKKSSHEFVNHTTETQADASAPDAGHAAESEQDAAAGADASLVSVAEASVPEASMAEASMAAASMAETPVAEASVAEKSPTPKSQLDASVVSETPVAPPQVRPDAGPTTGPDDLDPAADGDSGVDPPVAGSGGSSPMPGTPSCPSAVVPDTRAARREACAFSAGALPNDTLEITPEQRLALPLRHLIVMMKENRSFDHYFGRLYLQGQPDSEPLPTNFSNLDRGNQPVTPFHLSTTCLHNDPGHQWKEMHDQVNGGAMDGFVRSAAVTTNTDGHFAIGYYDSSDLPFYYFLANTFALADRHFAAVQSGTWPNRDYLLLATSGGVRESYAGYPSTTLPTIFNQLDQKGVRWAAYTNAVPFEGALNWPHTHPGVFDIAAFKRALADGTLPAVSVIDSKEDVEDEHATADIQVGEAWSRDIYEAVIASPLWPSTALVLTYDEAGGFFDHVPPPRGCVASPSESTFNERGARVPTIVISPWARAHYVSHVVRDHTAILRLIETVFDLPALTARDANSDAMLEMFDFACPARLAPPPAPPAGAAGCN
jgi:phospholipase C